MADERPEQPADNEDELSASALFLEMMRQAAARRMEQQATSDSPQEIVDEDKIYYEALPPDPKTLFATAMLAPEMPEFVEAVVPEETQVLPDYPAHSEELPDTSSLSVRDLPAPIEEDVEESFTEERVEASPLVPETPIYEAPPTEDSSAALLEAQRIRRIHRRREQQIRHRVGIFGGFFRSSFVILFSAALASTIFTWFTNPQFFTAKVITELQVADSTSVAVIIENTPTIIAVTPNWARRIGIVSGHRGPQNDPGAVCPDGLTEASVNFAVAQLVVRELRELGYSVDLLDEFDPRLDNYQAAALISIHSNDCRDYGEFVSGYLVARAAARASGGLDDTLAECIARDYGELIGIERRFSLTVDMTDYHTFREIHPLTPAAIIELGFLKDDRPILTERQPDMAQGIVDGILCFMNGEEPLGSQAALTPFPMAEATEAIP